METVTLKNGTVEAKPLVAVTLMSLEHLINPDPIAFYELVMVCRDRDHLFFVETRPKGGYWKRHFRGMFGKPRPDWEPVGCGYPCLDTAKRQAVQFRDTSKNAGYQYRIAFWIRAL